MMKCVHRSESQRDSETVWLSVIINAVELKGRNMASEQCQANYPSHSTCINLFIKSSAMYNNTFNRYIYGSSEPGKSLEQYYTIVQWPNIHPSPSRLKEPKVKFPYTVEYSRHLSSKRTVFLRILVCSHNCSRPESNQHWNQFKSKSSFGQCFYLLWRGKLTLQRLRSYKAELHVRRISIGFIWPRSAEWSADRNFRIRWWTEHSD